MADIEKADTGKNDYVLLGFRRFYSDKSEKNWCTMYFKGQAPTREECDGFYGEKCWDAMVALEDNQMLYDYLQPWMIGKRVNVFLTFDKEIGMIQCLEKEPPHEPEKPDVGKKA